jgi:hypothetical protein
MTEQRPKSELGDFLRSVGAGDKFAALDAYLNKVAHRLAQQLSEAGGKLPAEYLIPAPADAFQKKAAQDFIWRHFEHMHASPPYPKISVILGPAGARQLTAPIENPVAPHSAKA